MAVRLVFDKNYRLGVNVATGLPLATVDLVATAAAATEVTLQVTKQTGQTGHLQDWSVSAPGTPAAYVNVSGVIYGWDATATAAARAVLMDFATVPQSVSLTAASAGTVTTRGARVDHRHLLDVAIAPTWTGAHTFTRPSGTAPFAVGTAYAAGATVTNLSADLLDGAHASAFATLAGTNLFAAVNTFSVAPVFTLGIDLSTSGQITSAVAVGTTVACDIVDTVDRSSFDSSFRSFRIRNSVSGSNLMEVSSRGEYGFGINPTSGIVLYFAANTITFNTGTPIGIAASMAHSNSGITPGSVRGLSAVAAILTSTIPTGEVAGVKGSVTCTSDQSSCATLELAAILATPGIANALTLGFNGIGSQLKGNWKRVSGLRVGLPAAGVLGGTNRPGIATGAYLPIPGNTATAGYQWGLEIATESALGSTTKDLAAASAAIKIPFPAGDATHRATRRAHLFFSDNVDTSTIGGFAAPAGGPTGNVRGDVYFDAGTYNPAGLHEFAETQWAKLINDKDILFCDDEIVFDDDDLVYA